VNAVKSSRFPHTAENSLASWETVLLS